MKNRSYVYGQGAVFKVGSACGYYGYILEYFVKLYIIFFLSTPSPYVSNYSHKKIIYDGIFGEDLLYALSLTITAILTSF